MNRCRICSTETFGRFNICNEDHHAQKSGLLFVDSGGSMMFDDGSGTPPVKWEVETKELGSDAHIVVDWALEQRVSREVFGIGKSVIFYDQKKEDHMRPMNVYVILLMTAKMQASAEDTTKLEVVDYINHKDCRIVAENVSNAIAKLDVAGYIKENGVDPSLVFYSVVAEAKPIQIK